jgi:hypothetical protein
MMQPVEEGQEHETAYALIGPLIGCILVQGKMGPPQEAATMRQSSAPQNDLGFEVTDSGVNVH